MTSSMSLFRMRCSSLIFNIVWMWAVASPSSTSCMMGVHALKLASTEGASKLASTEGASTEGADKEDENELTESGTVCLAMAVNMKVEKQRTMVSTAAAIARLFSGADQHDAKAMKQTSETQKSADTSSSKGAQHREDKKK